MTITKHTLPVLLSLFVPVHALLAQTAREESRTSSPRKAAPHATAPRATAPRSTASHAIAKTVAPKSAPPTAATNSNRFGKVSVAGVSIQNLHEAEARRRLTRELAPKLGAVHTLTDGHHPISRKRRDLGVHLDIERMLARARRGDARIPALFSVDRAALTKALRRIAPSLSHPARDAYVTLSHGKTVIIPEQDWQKLNVAASVVAVAAQIEKNPAQKVLTLKFQSKSPVLTKARLQGINGVLGTFKTDFNAGKVKRTNNMRIAIKAIDGTLLSPNEIFSLNKTVGERTQARGYRTTIVFMNGYKAPGIGGGVSQVTGTLFNAALLAGLPIVSYRTHSQPVAYLPLGRDATVAWGEFDMKFKNNTGAPIYIRYKINEDTVTATLFGKVVPGKKVSLRVVSKNVGKREITAQLFRTTRQNGKVVQKERIGTSHYKWNSSPWED